MPVLGMFVLDCHTRVIAGDRWNFNTCKFPLKVKLITLVKLPPD
jgi:hypothetical protein